MFRFQQLLIVFSIALTASLTHASPPSNAQANGQHELVSARFAPAPTRAVDLVIALDVSTSMNGLIDSAKQRLWDVVNELGRAQPQPDLRVAIVTYGNPGYGKQNGFVKINQPFTDDLDAVNQQLFSFTTNGGAEYVARAISRSVHELQWSEQPDAMRIMFVAGNESASQDPQMTLAQVTKLASEKNIVVNTIYCGPANNSDAVSWQETAQRAGGMYASIDQNAAAVAQISAPQDAELTALNTELNQTYIAFGKEGQRRRDNQQEQDSNAAGMSASAAVSRTIAKASSMYRAKDWDLVDALDDGQKLEEVAEADLPAVMQPMTEPERARFVEQKAEKRLALKQKIGELSQQRAAFIEEELASRPEPAAPGLDSAIKDGLHKVAKQQGFEFVEK